VVAQVVELPSVAGDVGWDAHIEAGRIPIPSGREQIRMRYCCTRYLITRDCWGSTGACFGTWDHWNIAIVLVVGRFQNQIPRQ